MRFFRIPSFTGIEAHRDDADRGSLRLVEGCLPHGPGGLRSGPVWKKIGDVQYVADGDQNKISSADDGLGNSVIFVSRQNEVHDIALLTTEHTELESLTDQQEFEFQTDEIFSDGPANITPVGNQMYAVGDGSSESLLVGKEIAGAEVGFPDELDYRQEWSRFPKCKFYVQGPKKTIFAAGNPDKPLTVYISEPAGLTSPYRDTPYSTESTTYNQGVLSTVDILGSNASVITALSTRGDQVVVHTDKGCHLLYAPAPDQAITGYRVEQAPATNFSAAVNSKVVSRASGTLTYWVGHDGQVYKDEAASRGSEDLRSRADEDQANWKSKGVWEHELPTDLTYSFAVYSPQAGMYWFFVESEEKKTFDLIPRTPMRAPRNLIARILAPFFGPTNLNAFILPPANGPINLLADLLPPKSGPFDLNASIIPPQEGPVNLNAIVLPPQEGPIDLTAIVLPPQEGPIDLTAIVLPPQEGAVNLNAIVLPPQEGPVNLNAIVLPPQEGPTDLTAEVLPPTEGPVNLNAIVLPPLAGPTNLQAIEIIGPFTAKFKNTVSGGWNLDGYSSVQNTGGWSTFLSSYQLNSNTGQPITFSVRAEVDNPAATAYFHKIYIPEEVIFNPGADDPYWDSENRWYYKSEADNLTFNQNAEVEILWVATPVAPYLGPTNLIASIEGSDGGGSEDPSTESKYIRFQIAESGNESQPFGGWQSDSVGFQNPGGVVMVSEDISEGLSFLGGNQVIEIGGRNGHVETVYHEGILVKNDNGYFDENTVYTVSAEAKPGWYFQSWDIEDATDTPASERYPILGLPRGEVEIISGSYTNPTNLTLKVTDATNYIVVKAQFTDVNPNPDPDPGNKYNLENCECVSDNGSGLGDFDTLQDCEDWKEVATFNCVDGECVEDDMQMGTYPSCSECMTACAEGTSIPCDDTAGIYDYSPENNTCFESMEPSSMQYTECDCVEIGATIT